MQVGFLVVGPEACSLGLVSASSQKALQMNTAAPRLSVPALLLGLPVLRRSARRVLSFTRLPVAGFARGVRGYHSRGFFGLALLVSG